jgi:hypothetical protein
MRLDQPRRRQLRRVRLGADQRIGQRRLHGLHRQLHLLQTGRLQGNQPLLGQTDAGSDQVGVETDAVGVGDQFLEIIAEQGFATGEAKLQRAQIARLLQ